MPDVIASKQQWEQALLSSFLGMVQAADGDFAAIDQLAVATSDGESFQLMIQRLCLHEQGQRAFAERLSLGAINLAELHKLPSNTLGYLYATHMIVNQLKPLQASTAENDYQFLGMHITETHDIWHVVTGSQTDILGEIQLEAFSLAQLAASRFWLALLTKNLVKSLIYDVAVSTQYMDALTRGWIMGKNAKPLFGVDWTTLWETAIKQVRDSLNIVDV